MIWCRFHGYYHRNIQYFLKREDFVQLIFIVKGFVIDFIGLVMASGFLCVKGKLLPKFYQTISMCKYMRNSLLPDNMQYTSSYCFSDTERWCGGHLGRVSPLKSSSPDGGMDY